MAQKSLKKNAFFNFVKAFMSIIFPIISFPYASRILLPEGIGSVNFANSTVEYFTMLAKLGISTYAAREAARVRDDKYELSKLAREILSINFVSTAISYILFFIAIFFIPKYADYRLLLIVCSTKVLFMTIGMEWLYTAEEEFGYITIRHTFFQVISLVLLFTFVKTKNDYLIYAGIGVISNVGANVFNLIYSRKFINIFEKTTLSIKKHIKPLFTFFGTSFASKVNDIIDTIMLGFLLSNTAVGFYVAAIKLSSMVKDLITSVISSFMPRSSYYLENNKVDEYKKIINKILGMAFFFSIPATLGLIFLCEPLISIFSGENYLPAAPTMKLLAFTIIFTSFNSFLSNVILVPTKKENFMLYAQIVALTANVTLNYFFIKQWGVFGAGLATLMVEVTLPAVKLFPSWKYICNKSNLFSILKSAFGAIVMYLIIYTLFKNMHNDFLKIICSVSVGSLTYAVVEIALKHETALLFLRGIMKKLKIVNH